MTSCHLWPPVSSFFTQHDVCWAYPCGTVHLHYFFISPPILKASPLLFMAEACSVLIGMDTPHFVNTLCKVDEQLGCLHPLATVNSAARTSTCLDTHFRFPGCIPSGRFVGSFSKFVLSFVRDSPTVCDSNGTTLHPHQQCPRVPIASPCHFPLLLLLLLPS